MHRGFRGFFLHLHPRKVASETLRFSLSFGLGGMSATLLLLLFLTGIVQLFSYSPALHQAYDSVRSMYSGASPAGFIRNVHYWSGNLLVIVAVLHFGRVFLTGAITAKRRANWFVGLILLGLVLFANFTGYLLPWDQLAFWAVTIFTSMLGYIPLFGESIVELLRGGKEIGAATLSIFFTVHAGLLPFCFAVTAVLHFWQVRNAGGLVRRQNTQDSSAQFVPVVPELIVREAAAGFTLCAAVLVIAALFDAPLEDMANPAMSPNPAKAVWFFMGFQELLMHLHPAYAILVLPLLCITFLIVLPFWKEAVLPAGHWFGDRRGRWLALWSAVTGATTTFAVILIDEKIQTNGMNVAVDAFRRGALPLLVCILFFAAGYTALTRMMKFSRAQAVMAVCIFSFTSFCCLTAVAAWLRGPGMRLLFPG